MPDAPSQTPPFTLPIAWAQFLNQSVDDTPVAGAFPFQADPQAFTRVNGAGQITLNQHRILRLTAATARRSLAAGGWEGPCHGRLGRLRAHQCGISAAEGAGLERNG